MEAIDFEKVIETVGQQTTTGKTGCGLHSEAANHLAGWLLGKNKVAEGLMPVSGK